MKIGLVGFNCVSGLGEMNRQLSTFLDIESWLLVKSQHLNLPDPENIKLFSTAKGRDLRRFICSVDVVLFEETPFIPKIPKICKRSKIRCVCVLMLEWFPLRGWIDDVDLFICPTRQGYDFYKSKVPCIYFPWPVDTQRFEFHQRTKVEQFLFLNGHGGWNGRKGSDVICKAKEIWPEMPLIVRSQKIRNWPDGVTVLPTVKENRDLYNEGDILVSPHSVDGTGLEPMEAMACGMPVISTNGLPWNEIPAIGRIQSTETLQSTAYQFHKVPWYTPNPHDLVTHCKRLLGTDITEESKKVRAWAEQRSFSKRAQDLRYLVSHGKATE